MNKLTESNKSDNGFSDWFYELEGFAYRSERFQDEIEHFTALQDYQYARVQMMKWLMAAYQVGYKTGRNK